MRKIVIKKGHDIKISGVPNSKSYVPVLPRKISLSPNSFRNVKPKLLVSEGDIVKIGTPLFYDKTKSKVKFASPVAGKVTKIGLGLRRAIEFIEIEIDGSDLIINDSLNGKDLSSISGAEVLQFILN